jgi:hypothetical protein
VCVSTVVNKIKHWSTKTDIHKAVIINESVRDFITVYEEWTLFLVSSLSFEAFTVVMFQI